METTKCIDPNCKRPGVNGGLCVSHQARQEARVRRALARLEQTRVGHPTDEFLGTALPKTPASPPVPPKARAARHQGSRKCLCCDEPQARDGYCRVHWFPIIGRLPMQARHARRFKVEDFRETDVLGIQGAPQGASPADVCWITGQAMEPLGPSKRGSK